MCHHSTMWCLMINLPQLIGSTDELDANCPLMDTTKSLHIDGHEIYEDSSDRLENSMVNSERLGQDLMESQQPWIESNTTRRSSRICRPTQKLLSQENDRLTLFCKVISYITTCFNITPAAKSTYKKLKGKLKKDIDDHQARLQMYNESLEMNVDRSLNFIHPMSLIAMTGANNTVCFHQTMQ